MAIPNPDPTIIPPHTEPKTYPHLWITNFRVRSTSPTEGNILVDVSPYNADTGEILLNETRRIYVSDMWEAISQVPEAAAALTAVFASLPAIEAWQNPPVVEDPPPEEPPEDPPA